MIYRVEWMPVAGVIGLVTLLFVPVLGLLVGLAIVMFAAMALVVLAGAVLATPFLIVRAVHRRQRVRTALRRSQRRVNVGEPALPPARVG
jgi:hypothetical protein